MSGSISKIINELNNKNFNKALNLCEEYSANKDLHILNNLKGIIFVNLKDQKNAIEYFKKSLIYKENYIEGYSNLANAYFSTKNFSKSIKTIIKASIYDKTAFTLPFSTKSGKTIIEIFSQPNFSNTVAAITLKQATNTPIPINPAIFVPLLNFIFIIYH